MVTWREVLARDVAALRDAGVGSPDAEARWIVGEAAGHEGAALVAHLDDAATARALAYHDGMVSRRVEGEPIQYVLGRWGFRSLDLAVDTRALIPRPETEQVVEVALAELDRVGGRDRRTCVADLGTGTGAIALSVAIERPRTEVYATDVSSDALALARANLAGLGRAGRAFACSRARGSRRCRTTSVLGWTSWSRTRPTCPTATRSIGPWRSGSRRTRCAAVPTASTTCATS